MAPIRRIGSTKASAKWYICGSYALDHLCGASYAGDVDVCYFRDTENPGTPPIANLAATLGMAISPPHPQFVRVDGYYPQAGGYPSLNIDFLPLDMDGNVYVVDPVTKARSLYQFTGTIDLKIVDASALTPLIARKALTKLVKYACLKCDAQTLAALKAKAAGQ